MDVSWHEYLEHLSEEEREQVSADEAEAKAAMAEMLADPNLIAEFSSSLERAKTTREKYKRCVQEFSDFLAACSPSRA